MSSLPRKKIEEIRTFLRLNGECHDIFVEGPSDKAILRQFLTPFGLSSVAIYTIETVEIPNETVRGELGRDGNNCKIVFLAKKISDTPALSSQLTCVIDADYSHCTQEFYNFPSLLHTDYSCMEMYFYCKILLRKILTIKGKNDGVPIDDVFETLGETLQELFLLRYAADQLDWNLDWFDEVKCLQVDGWRIIFDRDEFIKRLLQKNAVYKNLEIFNKKVADLRLTLKDDVRYQIHGHDFVAVLAWYLRSTGIATEFSGDYSKVDNLREMLVVGTDFLQLQEEQMFSALALRVMPEQQPKATT